MSSALRILIVGAGIAGCCTAAALAGRGHRVTLIEKQAVWRFQSSGIFVYSNGLESLRDVGVADAVLATGFAVDQGRNRYLDHLGQPIVDVYYPRSVDGQLPAILGIKRAELHRVLVHHLDSLGLAPRLDTAFTRLDEHADGVTVTFSDGRQEAFDLVIGADGVRSQVRAHICGDLPPRYSGFGVWRSVHRRPPELRDKVMLMGPGKRLGIMPVSEGHLYLFGTVRQPEGLWMDPARWPALMRESFAEFQGPVRPFLDELGEGSEVLYTAVEEVIAPLPWHRGRVLLIGDAAHASTPFMGQGGAMAMADAVELARQLPATPDADALEAALTHWSALRQPVCRLVQDASRAVGEAGARELNDPQACLQRDQAMRENAQRQVDAFFAQLRQPA